MIRCIASDEDKRFILITTHNLICNGTQEPDIIIDDDADDDDVPKNRMSFFVRSFVRSLSLLLCATKMIYFRQQHTPFFSRLRLALELD